VLCGPGNDTAILDKVDVIVDATPANPNGSCENVRRADPKPKKGQTSQSEPSTDSNGQTDEPGQH